MLIHPPRITTEPLKPTGFSDCLLKTARFCTVLSIILMRNPPTIKLKKHENICHLQRKACNALVNK